jgi:hypothetical protein
VSTAVATGVKVRVGSIAKQFVIALSVATVYFCLANISPFGALSAVPILSFVTSLRWSNILRPLVLAWPGAAWGIAAGSYAVNVASGKVALGSYQVMPIIMLVIGLAAYGASKAWGRSLDAAFPTLTSAIASKESHA